jgi:hypothetical protein
VVEEQYPLFQDVPSPEIKTKLKQRKSSQPSIACDQQQQLIPSATRSFPRNPSFGLERFEVVTSGVKLKDESSYEINTPLAQPVGEISLPL